MAYLRLKIGQRLAFGYGFVILLLIATTMAGVSMMGQLSARMDDALKDKYPNTQSVNEVTVELGNIARAMRNSLIMREPSQVAAQLEDISRSKYRLAELLDQLNRRVTDRKGKELLQQVEIIRSAYNVNQEEFINLLNQGKIGEAKNLLLVDLNPYQEDFFSALGKLLQHQTDLMNQASGEVEHTYHFARKAMFALTLFAALLSVAITFTITRALIRQLGGEPDYATAIARRIADGDLSSGIKIEPSDNASLLYAMKAMRDKLIERSNALQSANTELEHSVEALHTTQDDLVRSEKLAALGSLVAGVAHELNTPIGNSMLAASALVDHTRAFALSCSEGHLKRSSLDTFLADVNSAGDILLRNLYRSVDLVTSFKQVAVDRESSQGRQFGLSETIAEIILILWPTLKKSGVVVHQDVPKDIRMDSYPGPLGQVVTNIVNNAVIHGFEGGPGGNVWISAADLGGGWIELAIRDDGLGIDPKNLHRIYDPFFTTKLGRGGSGLGLNIVYNIVHGVLGGKIEVRSEVGKGTCFTLTLPIIGIAVS